MANLVCWRCGAGLDDIPQPFARLAQCKACSADLHVCRLCQFYNPRLHDKCDNDQAEPAREVDVANFCDYFRPRPGAYTVTDNTRADDAMNQFKALFADSDPPANPTQESAPTDKPSDPPSDKERFDALFKKD
ncbi:MAG: hypothetical protein P8Z75_01615 [Gammaproteobacteria bacterium]|jgi:hypothetical protein